MDKKYEKISQDLGVTLKQIDTVLSLTAEGATIPFIARYRKDMTGSLDEVAIKAIIDLDKSLTNLNDRKEAVLAKIQEQGKLTKELEEAILVAEKLADVEELYLPYKEKRRTKATIAREAGLFPLARLILQNIVDLEKEAEKFVCEGFATGKEALTGAVDILVEALSEDVTLRSMTYQEVLRHSKLTSQAKDESLDEKQVFQIYYDFSETVGTMQGYRTLALNRGEKLGVGQYQHDVSQKKLSESLDFVVDTVVNQVGVNVNTASPALLSHVAGLNKTISENIVKYREEEGKITSRAQIKKVPRLGAKAFEQAAGFLRIPESSNILDNTGVHPENYTAVKELFKRLDIKDLNEEAQSKLKSLSVKEMAQELDLGPETLKDIIADLLKPGRDFRDSFDAPVLRQDVLDIKDLVVGQKLEGVVRNVVDFGAFVDIGIHEDGLIHISHMSRKFIKHPSQVVSVGDLVTVWVKKIDTEREKVNLSLLAPNETD
ncbi:S1 RNA-binding domain-containing protein [Streptococcus pneumoniae]|uniref:helix-hairpin-helix domain-containing protein n=1 Tax=Streptococcus pneumoniae TaxID=1313 RepID=UPI000768A680|nr:Tex-like N-terminal domain-containing protein [Streptococcus pneumoniae]CXF99278.1 S1 RNA-binding domain-containing protein [Streptococcus pneumoniae]